MLLKITLCLAFSSALRITMIFVSAPATPARSCASSILSSLAVRISCPTSPSSRPVTSDRCFVSSNATEDEDGDISTLLPGVDRLNWTRIRIRATTRSPVEIWSDAGGQHRRAARSDSISSSKATSKSAMLMIPPWEEVLAADVGKDIHNDGSCSKNGTSEVDERNARGMSGWNSKCWEGWTHSISPFFLFFPPDFFQQLLVKT